MTQFFASFFIYFLFLGLIILWFIDGKIKKEQVVHALFASFIAWVVAITIKYFFPSTRPFELNGAETHVLFTPTSSAFPSEHAIIAFAVSVTVFLHDRAVGRYFLLAALVVGAARVLANVHYPIDIVGGAFLGTIVAILVDKTHFLKIFKRG